MSQTLTFQRQPRLIPPTAAATHASHTISTASPTWLISYSGRLPRCKIHNDIITGKSHHTLKKGFTARTRAAAPFSTEAKTELTGMWSGFWPFAIVEEVSAEPAKDVRDGGEPDSGFVGISSNVRAASSIW